MKQSIKILLSGGGTGGHIFPAISIAQELKRRFPNAQFLFIGAQDRMEMEKVPQAGFDIKGLWISGLQRKLSAANLMFPFKNSYPGITNKFLAKKALKICVAYDNLEAFFPADKLIKTGNPVRQDLLDINTKRSEAIEFFNLDTQKKTLLVIGGSLGARMINTIIEEHLPLFDTNNVQVIWQTGKLYYDEYKKHDQKTGIQTHAFLNRMDLAYAGADFIISRAGAGSISELCIVGKPVLFIPSPNVAEDHQTKNAQAIVSKQAALMLKESETKL